MSLLTLDGCREGFYRGMVLGKDPYLMKKWKHDFFDTIFDIGANVGIFTLYSSMRHSGAKVFAYEPSKEAFAYLVTTNSFLSNVTFINEALGDGSMLSFRPHKSPGSVQFHKAEEYDEQLDHYTVKSSSLSDMFKSNKVDTGSNYFIKMDCEGGERFLLDDEESIDILRNSCGTAIQLHFPGVKSQGKGDFRTFPPWETYKSWVHDNFSRSHDAIYHHSNKRVGSGVYVLLNKDGKGRND